MRAVRLGAATLLVGALASSAALAGESTANEKAAAQQTFEAGGKLYDGHHFEEALVAFRASYQIKASPNSHLMVARCLKELGRDAEAYGEYGSVISEASGQSRYESAGKAAGEERTELRARIALLTVRVKESPPGLVVKVGEDTVSAAALGVAEPHAPGAVVVTATADGGRAARADVTLVAGGDAEVLLALAAPEEKTEVVAAPAAAPTAPTRLPDLRTWAYVAGGVSVAGLATFGIFGALSGSKYSSLESSCPSFHCPPAKQDDIDSGKGFQTIANIGLVVGIVGAGAGVTLFVLSRKSSPSSAHDERAKVELGLCSVSARGYF